MAKADLLILEEIGDIPHYVQAKLLTFLEDRKFRRLGDNEEKEVIEKGTAMLKVVEEESAIRRYQRQFVRAFRPLAEETIPVNLGHPGASVRARVSWSNRLGIWFFSRRIGTLGYWHAFGIGRPEGGANIPITCEINFPLCGIDRRTGGAFAEDHAGRVFVVHRGKLGGGRKGIGKSLFENHYRGGLGGHG